MSSITLLHVSDVHFRRDDAVKEQPRITRQLVRDARKFAKDKKIVPDILIFSGDLTQCGAEQEFALGEMWLSDLSADWPDCRLFVVPGNHEVARPVGPDKDQIIDPLRTAYHNKDAYARSKRDTRRGGTRELLKGFFEWHAEASTRIRLVSDWSRSPLVCRSDLSIDGVSVHIVGLNTALLSCDDDDRQKLVVDYGSLNEALTDLDYERELTIVVGHHPICDNYEKWLVEWNRAEVQTLLFQSTGPHLYLHGHLHEGSAITISSSTGQHLTNLAAGAAYQGAKYPQMFAFYTIDMKSQAIVPWMLEYNHGNGKWGRNDKDSQLFRAVLPLITETRPSLLERTIEALSSRSGWIDSCQLIRLSHSKRPLLNAEQYIEIVTYSPEGMIEIFEHLRDHLREDVSIASTAPCEVVFVKDGDDEKAISSVYETILLMLREYWPSIKPYYVVDAPHCINFIVNDAKNDDAFPLVFTVSSKIGESISTVLAWLNRLSEGNGGGNVVEHIDVLKRILYACERYVDIARKQVILPKAQLMAEDRSNKPTESTDVALRELKDIPVNHFRRIKQAFDDRDNAEKRKEESAVRELFEKAAQSFEEAEAGAQEYILRKSLAARKLEYWVKMERAYCLLLTGAPGNLDVAKTIYMEICRIYNADVTSRFRLGHVLRQQKRYDEAITYYKEAIERLALGRDKRIQKGHWIYSESYRHLAATYWRKSMIYGEGQEESKLINLREAIEACKKVTLGAHGDHELRLKGVNDLLYYHWEERIASERVGNTDPPMLADDEVSAFISDFEKLIIAQDEGGKPVPYFAWDTLCRVLSMIEGREADVRRAAERVVAMLQPNFDGKSLDEDENDAYIFALRRIAGV